MKITYYDPETDSEVEVAFSKESPPTSRENFLQHFIGAIEARRKLLNPKVYRSRKGMKKG